MTTTTPARSTRCLALDAVGQADLIRRGEVTAGRAGRRGDRPHRGARPGPERRGDPRVRPGRRRRSSGPLPAGPFTGVPFLLKDLAVEWEGVRFTEGSAFLRDNVSSHDQELTRRLEQAGLVLARQDQHARVRAATHLRAGTVRADPQPVGPHPDARGLQRRGRRRSRHRAWSRWPTATTPAAPSASRRRAAASSGSSRPAPASRSAPSTATCSAASPSSSPSPARCATPPCCSTHSPAPTSATPTGRRPRPGPSPPRSAPIPGGCASPSATAPRRAHPSIPTASAAVRDAAALCESLGHDVIERDLPGVYDQPYRARRPRRRRRRAGSSPTGSASSAANPRRDEIEPLTRACGRPAARVTAADYLLAVQDAQALGRTIARFFTDVDLWLTPTLAEPPVPDRRDQRHRRRPRAGHGTLVNASSASRPGSPTPPATPPCPCPLHWNADELPIGVHFLGRFGDEATLLRLAAQLEQAQPWADRRPPVLAPA